MFDNISEQIKEVERELALRKRVYAYKVREGKMKAEDARKHFDLMQDVLSTLRWVQRTEPTPLFGGREFEDGSGFAPGPT